MVRPLGFLFLFLVFAAGVQAQTLLYPGTFDPYHKNHHQELIEAAALLKAKSIVVLPVESASYHKNLPGKATPFPRLFGYADRLAFIRGALAGVANAQVSGDLMKIHSDVLAEIEQVSRKYPDPVILAGTDILEIWSTLPRFPQFLQGVRLLISEDLSAPDLNQRLREKFKNEKRIEFFRTEGIRQSIRSKDLMGTWAKSGQIPLDLFPDAIREYYRNNSEKIDMNFQAYMDSLKSYLFDSFDAEIRPALKKSMPADIFEMLMQDPEVVQFLLENDMTQGRELGLLTKLLADKDLMSTLPAKMSDYLSSFLYSGFHSDEVAKFYRKNSHAMNMIESGTGVFQEQKPAPDWLRKVSSMTNIFGFQTYKKYLAPLYQKLIFSRELQENFGRRGRTLPLTGEQVAGAKTITAYRGVPEHPDLEKHMQSWKSVGMFSKIALAEWLKTGSIEDAVALSRKMIEFYGETPVILNHVLGSWQSETSLISVTLDRKIAESYAGPRGVVLTIEVPVGAGYVVNDLAYWKETPWEQTGNPMAKDMEFVIPDQIRPEWIKAIDPMNGKEVPALPQPKLQENLKNFINVMQMRMRDQSLRCENVYL